MKRRDFIRRSAAVAGGSMFPFLNVFPKPCPPSAHSVSGGSTVTSICPRGDTMADWIARSTAPGVVWAHDFQSKSEVDQFRVASNGNGSFNDAADAFGSTLKHNTADGFASPGCLEITVPTGGTANGGWWRPMSAIRANDNGKTVDDLGSNGSLPRRAWNASDPNCNYKFRTGYYGNADVQAQYPTWKDSAGNTQTNVWDGTDFYIQFAVKISASRWQPINPYNPYGKLMFIDVTGETSDGEIVIQSSDAGQGYWHSTTPFRMYTSRGSDPNSFISNPQGAPQGATIQPKSPWDTTCLIGSDTTLANKCWEWPADTWVTVLVHVIPGHNNAGSVYESDLSKWPNHDFGLEVWVAQQGTFTYTKLFEKFDLAWYFASNYHPIGAYNSICPSAYMNNVNAIVGWFHRFDQIIFSKQMIPCPQA